MHRKWTPDSILGMLTKYEALPVGIHREKHLSRLYGVSMHAIVSQLIRARELRFHKRETYYCPMMDMNITVYSKAYAAGLPYQATVR